MRKEQKIDLTENLCDYLRKEEKAKEGKELLAGLADSYSLSTIESIAMAYGETTQAVARKVVMLMELHPEMSYKDVLREVNDSYKYPDLSSDMAISASWERIPAKRFSAKWGQKQIMSAYHEPQKWDKFWLKVGCNLGKYKGDLRASVQAIADDEKNLTQFYKDAAAERRDNEPFNRRLRELTKNIKL